MFIWFKSSIRFFFWIEVRVVVFVLERKVFGEVEDRLRVIWFYFVFVMVCRWGG